MEMELRNSDTSCSMDRTLPLPRASPQQWFPKTPSRDPCTWAGHFWRGSVAQPLLALAHWDSFLPPSSAFPQPPGQGRAHLAVFSCLPVTHVVLTGSPSQAGTFPVLLGVLFDFVGAPWSAAFFLLVADGLAWLTSGLASRFLEHRMFTVPLS